MAIEDGWFQMVQGSVVAAQPWNRLVDLVVLRDNGTQVAGMRVETINIESEGRYLVLFRKVVRYAATAPVTGGFELLTETGNLLVRALIPPSSEVPPASNLPVIAGPGDRISPEIDHWMFSDHTGAIPTADDDFVDFGIGNPNFGVYEYRKVEDEDTILVRAIKARRQSAQFVVLVPMTAVVKADYGCMVYDEPSGAWAYEAHYPIQFTLDVSANKDSVDTLGGLGNTGTLALAPGQETSIKVLVRLSDNATIIEKDVPVTLPNIPTSYWNMVLDRYQVMAPEEAVESGMTMQELQCLKPGTYQYHRTDAGGIEEATNTYGGGSLHVYDGTPGFPTLAAFSEYASDATRFPVSTYSMEGSHEVFGDRGSTSIYAARNELSRLAGRSTVFREYVGADPMSVGLLAYKFDQAYFRFYGWSTKEAHGTCSGQPATNPSFCGPSIPYEFGSGQEGLLLWNQTAQNGTCWTGDVATGWCYISLTIFNQVCPARNTPHIPARVVGKPRTAGVL